METTFYKWWGIILFLIFPLLAQSQISTGTYTIGGVSPDYATIQDAVTDLVTNGLAGNGPVIFNIADGNYDGQITIGSILNTDASSTVTFQSASGDSTKVSIMYAIVGSSDNYVLRLNGCSYVTFKKVRIYNYGTNGYTRVIAFAGTSKHNQILNSEIIGYNVSASVSNNAALLYSYGGNIDSLTVSDCYMQNGSMGFNLNGNGTVSTRIKIINNVISSDNGIYLNDMDRSTITGNTITANYSMGIEMHECDFNTLIANNIINVQYLTGGCKGIYLDACDGNVVDIGLVANNSISVEGSGSYDCYGIYLTNSDYQRFYNNSVHVINSKTSGSVYYASGGSNLELLNNNLVSGNLGYVVYLAAASIVSSSDYNNLYSGGNFLTYWGQNLHDLVDLQALGKDAHSTSYYPTFVSKTDLHIQTHWLDGTGTTSTQSQVPNDLDGNVRDASNPDVGAYEFTPVNPFAYSGTLTVGPSGDFVSLSEVVDSLELLGVAGPVTVQFADGTYPERVAIAEIPGASATNRITFTSASADSTKVSILYSSTSSSDASTLILQGSDYLTFKLLKIGNSSTGSYGRAINITGYAHDNVLENNIFNGAGSSYATNDRAVILSEGWQANHLTIQKNVFSGGSRHIVITGTDATVDILQEDINILNNVFNESETAVRLYFCKDINIASNQFNEFTYAGIQINSSENPVLIEKNKIVSTLTDDHSIRIESCLGPTGGLIKNNFISISNSSSIYGIYVASSQYLNFYNNSINVIGNNSANGGVYLSANTNVNFENNIWAVNGNGYALYSNDVPAGSVVFDYNDLYSTGANLVYWAGTNYASLTDYQSATSQDAHSVNLNPNYVSNTDLHTNSYWLDGAGTSLASVTDDIDGESRNNPPCIGADEYTSTLSPLSGTKVIGSGGDYATITEAVNALSENGISGNVVFEIVTGTYNEQFAIPQIFIVNAADSIVMKSQSGNPADVTIIYEGTNSTNNYIAKLEGTDNFSFQNLTFQAGNSEYSHCISMYGNLNRINITGCVFNGRSSASTTANDAIIFAAENDPFFNGVLIEDNTFNNGAWALDVDGSGSAPMEKLIVRNNTITSNYKGIYISDAMAPQLEKNTIHCLAADSYGIKLNACESSVDEPLRIIKNEIYSDYKTSDGGIYLYGVDGLGSQPAIIANNVIQNSAPALYNSVGIQLYGCSNLNIYYNSVNITGSSLTDVAFYSQGSDNLNIYNNSFAIRGALGNSQGGYGYALNITSGTNVVAAYNNLFSPGRYLAKWMGTNYFTLSELQSASGQFAHSLNVFPAYQSYNNLRTQSAFLNGAANYFAGVTDDFEGNARDLSSPDIGAFEIETPATPLAGGNYSVGNGGDLPGLDSMYRALFELGISGSVTFNIKDGQYNNVHLFFKAVPGTSANDSVIIQSESHDSTKVILGNVQTVDKNYIAFFNGSHYLTFKHLTFTSGGSGYGTILSMDGNSGHINILNNVLNGLNTNTYKTEMSSVYSAVDHVVDYVKIKDNVFNYNSYGVYLNGYSTYLNSSILIDGNRFVNQYNQIYLNKINSPKVQYNVLKDGQNSGMYFNTCTNAINVIGNQMATDYTNYYGIDMYYSDGSGVTPALIANNFVQCEGKYGIYLSYSDYYQVYYNTINHTGDNNGAAFYVSGGSNIQLENNIFNASSNGYAYYVSSNGLITGSDYNDIYAAGSRYAYWGTSVDTLSTLRSTSGMEAHSFEVAPAFLSKTDLHLISFDLMEQAHPIASITTDVDKELRDTVTPDIGADEIYARPPIVENQTICEGTPTPDLTALGINIKWYSDPELTDLIWTSDVFSPGVTAPGVYTYYVTSTISDDESDPAIVTLTILAAPVIAAVVANIDCQGNDYGSINLTVTGENKPFFYRWSNESTTEDISKLLPGDYHVTVEDIAGCTAVDSFTISAPDSIFLTTNVNDANCGEHNGSATVFAEGGTGQFEYTWNTGDSIPTIDSLVSGIYVVSVTDQNGCMESAIATVNDLGGSTITVDALNNVSCYGGDNGSIGISISGGVTPYTINWSNGATSEDVNNLVAGPYEIHVTDADGCKSAKSIKVNQPDPLLIGLGVFNANCGQSNGTATTNVRGGVAPYEYDWSNGGSDSQVTGLGLGVYHVTVTDANSCEAKKSFAISETGAPIVYVDSIIEGTCGNSDGAIYITAYGGTGAGLSYLWNTSSTEEDLVGINPGSYSVTVTDSVGCAGVAVATIEAEKPETPSICIVSVDTATNYNEVVWEKPVTDQIDHYNIYRESTQSGVYLKVGEHPYSNESIFVDENSNAKQRSYRYKISSTDVCGVESDLSAHHKTMHLTLNLGLSNTVNLIWDHYEGFEISTYYIYRYTLSEGWKLYDSIPSNLTSYTDFDAPLKQLSYFIEIRHPFGCTATKATNRNTSRSNVRTTVNTSVNTAYNVEFHVSDGTNVIQGAEVTFVDSVKITGSDGLAVFIGISPGNQLPYMIKKSGFEDFSSAIDIVDQDVSENVVLIPVGINEDLNGKINIFPNPNGGSFYLSVDMTGVSELEYQLFNCQGAELNRKKCNILGKNANIEINIPNQVPGIYFLKIRVDQRNLYRKIVVE